MPKISSRFRIKLERGKVLNEGKCPSIGKESNDLVRIIIVFFDLEGFTNFFDSAPINKNIIVASYVNSFLSWMNHQIELEVQRRRLPQLPRLSKFLGDGVLYVWEVEQQKITSRRIIDLINFCWNITCGKDSYEEKFLPQYMSRLGNNWSCNYPQHLRTSVALGHAVKYIQGNRSVDYVSECINVASRLIKINPELYFIAHSDVYLGTDDMFLFDYVKKKIPVLRGINKPVVVYIDEDDYNRLSDKSMFQDMP